MCAYFCHFYSCTYGFPVIKPLNEVILVVFRDTFQFYVNFEIVKETHVATLVIVCKALLISNSFRRVMAERFRTVDVSSGVSDRRRVGLNPGPDTCVLEQDTLP